MGVLSRTVRKIITFVIVALMIGAMPVAASQAQDFDPDFYTSELTGLDVEVSGPFYAISDVELQHYPSGDGEIIQIDSDTLLSSVEVSFFDDADTVEETIDIYLNSMENASDEFKLVSSGADGDYTYALAVVQYQGVEIVYYVQVFEDLEGNADLFEAILSSGRDFEADLEVAQDEITIDGVPFMENVVPADLVELLADDGTVAAETTEAPSEPTSTVNFTVTDAYVGLGPDFSFMSEPEVRAGLEGVRIQGPNTLSLVAVGQTGDAPIDVMDSFQQGIVSVYPGSEPVVDDIGDEQGWRILSVPNENGPDFYMLVVVDTTVMPGAELMHAHEIPADGAAVTIALLQSQIFFNGAPIMPEIDPVEIEAHVLEHSGQTATDTTAVATEEVTEEATSEAEETEQSGNPRDGAQLPTDDDDDTGNTSETGGDSTAEATEETGTESSDVPGVLTDGSWEGGVFGNVIEWDDAIWFVDVDYPDDLVSDADAQEDSIVLQTETDTGSTWFFISVFGDAELSPDDYLDYWTSEAYLEESGLNEQDAEVIDSRTRGDGVAVVVRYANADGDEFIVVRQAVALEDGTIMLVTLDAPIEDAAAAYDLALEVSFNERPVLSVFSSSQFQRTVGD